MNPMKTNFIPSAFLAVALCASTVSAAAPRIQFDKTVFDFGKVSSVESVTGTFKYTNVGDAELKIEPPKASCGCTVTELKADTLQPGESGELLFTLNLGRTRAEMAKHISITSNDPNTPTVGLIIKADYIPLYDLEPTALAPDLAFGTNADEQFTLLTRTDGKPLKIVKVEASKPWITAALVPGASSGATTAKIRVAIQREGEPRRFNEFVHVYVEGQPDLPAASISLHGQMRGEVTVSPEALYWSITDAGAKATGRPEALDLRRMTIRSASGRPFEITNARSTIPGVSVEVATKEAGKAYELLVSLKDAPAKTVGGKISFDTSVAGQAHIEVPAIVNVFQP
jgi:hypothetical protein